MIDYILPENKVNTEVQFVVFLDMWIPEKQHFLIKSEKLMFKKVKLEVSLNKLEPLSSLIKN